MTTPAIDLTEFSQAKIALFIFDPFMKMHAGVTLKHLGFVQVTDHPVPRTYFEALAKLIQAISSDAQLVLLNLPPRPAAPGRKDEVTPIYDQINAMYLDIKAHLAKRTADPLKLLSKTVPMIETGDYLREKLVEVLFRYRVPAAFFMSALPPTRHLTGARKEQQSKENLQTHFRELSNYLNQYFRDKEELVALADEKISEKDLTVRKKKYDQFMTEAQRQKEAGDYEGAIGLLRQAIDIYPKDIEAFLESGRLYTRRREYGRALARFAQAEDLFQDAPAPNKEIADLRLTQVQEKVAAGADPNSPEIKTLLEEAVANYTQAHAKFEEMARKQPADTKFEATSTVGQDILKWNLSEMLGPKHPAVRALMSVAEKSTAGLDKLPVDQLSTSQLLTLGLQAVERRDVPLAQKYYFRALMDTEHFAQICTEINFMGIRLRSMGLVDEAIKIYLRLLKYKPHNQGSVYWNLALAYAFRKDTLSTSGYIVRSLYTDPYLAREKEFYDSISPQLAPILFRVIKALRTVLSQSRTVQVPSQLIKLHQARDRLVGLIGGNQRGEALKLFLLLFKQAPRFTVEPEFHADGVIPVFLEEMKAALARHPQHQATLKTINGYLKYLADHPTPPAVILGVKLTQSALNSLEEGDQPQTAYYVGQLLVAWPEAYFERPNFFARDVLPAICREIASKFQLVDIKRLPKPGAARSVASGQPAPGPRPANQTGRT